MVQRLLIITLLVSLTVCFRVHVRINEQQENKILTENQMQFFNHIKLVVDGSNEYIYPESNSVFTIPNLSNGVHIIEAISNDYIFPVLIVDKRVESTLKMRWLNPLDRKFIKAVNEPYLSPLEKIKYFEPQPSFPIVGFLMGGNGLFILMGVVMIFCYKGMNKLAQAQMAPNAQSAEHSISGNANRRA